MAKERRLEWELTTLDKLAKVHGTSISEGAQKDLAETLNEDETLLFNWYKELKKYLNWKGKTIREENFNDLIIWTVMIQNLNYGKRDINLFINKLKNLIDDDVALKELIQKEYKLAKAVLKAINMLKWVDKDFLKDNSRLMKKVFK